MPSAVSGRHPVGKQSSADTERPLVDDAPGQPHREGRSGRQTHRNVDGTAVGMNMSENTASTRASVQGTHKINHTELYGVGLEIELRVISRSTGEFRIRRTQKPPLSVRPVLPGPGHHRPGRRKPQRDTCGLDLRSRHRRGVVRSFPQSQFPRRRTRPSPTAHTAERSNTAHALVPPPRARSYTATQPQS